MNRKFQVKSVPNLSELEVSTAMPLRWLQEAKNLFVDKVSEQQRAEFLQTLETRINQLTDLSGDGRLTLTDLSGLNKNGGFNALATRVFLHNSQQVFEIDTKRLQILSDLKNRAIVNEEKYQSLYSIYKNVFLGRLQLEYSLDQSEIWRKNCKSIMTSLKKMMVLKTKKQKKSIRPTKDSQRYTVNLDVKHLIKCCEMKSKDDKTLNKKILSLIQKTKSGWAGPRLWKIVYEQKWTTEEIEIFIQFFVESLEDFQEPRSDQKKFRVAAQRIIQNLKALNSKTQIESEPTQAGWDDMTFQLPVYEKCAFEIELREYEDSGIEARSIEEGTLQSLSWL